MPAASSVLLVGPVNACDNCQILHFNVEVSYVAFTDSEENGDDPPLDSDSLIVTAGDQTWTASGNVVDDDWKGFDGIPVVSSSMSLKPDDGGTTLSATGTGGGSVDDGYEPPGEPYLQLKITGDSKCYDLYVDGSSVAADDEGSNSYTVVVNGQSHDWTVELRPKNQHPNSGDGGSMGGSSDDGSSGSSGGTGEGPTGGYGSSLSLGVDNTGKSAGTISWDVTSLQSSVFTPASLSVQAGDSSVGTTVILNGGSPRQVKTTSGLADIVPNQNGLGFEIRFYPPTAVGSMQNGLYTVTGSPTKVWRVDNSNGSSGTLATATITKTEGGTTSIQQLGYDSTSKEWSMTTGSGNSTQTVSDNTIVNAQGDLVETVTTVDATQALLSKVVNTFHDFAWGRQKVKSVNDPNGAALTTWWTYYTDSGDSGNYSQLASIEESTGKWTKYAYNSSRAIAKELSSWKDVTLAGATDTNCRTILHAYVGINSSTTESIEGVQVRQTSFYHTSITDGGSTWISQFLDYGTTPSGEAITINVKFDQTAATTTKTTTVRYSNNASALVAGKIKAIASPGAYDYNDPLYLNTTGPVDLYDYQSGAWNASTGTFTSGSGGALMTTVSHMDQSGNPVTGKSTRDVTVTDENGNQVLSQLWVHTGTQFDLATSTSTVSDTSGNTLSITQNGRQTYSAIWQNNLITSETDQTGTQTGYTYYSGSALVHTATRIGIAAGNGHDAQPDVVTTYAYDGLGRILSKTDTAGGLSRTTSTQYDSAGRVLTQTDAAGLVTHHTYSVSSGHMTETVIHPDGGTEIRSQLFDGNPKSISGTAVAPVTFDYSGLNTVQTSGDRIMTTRTDPAGRTLKIDTTGYAGQITKAYYYYKSGHVDYMDQTGMPSACYAYDSLGNQTGVDLSYYAFSPTYGRIKETITSYQKISGNVHRITTQQNYLTDWDGTPTVLNTTDEQLSGLASSTISSVVATGADGQQSTTVATISGKIITQTVSDASSNNPGVSVTVNGLPVSRSTPTASQPEIYGYDALGRMTSTTDSQGNLTGCSFNSAGQIATTTDAATNTTQIAYYPDGVAGAGQVSQKTLPGTTILQYEYDLMGNVIHEYGTAAYEIRKTFNAYGQIEELDTYRTAVTPQQTLWHYHPASGLLVSKTDSSSKSVIYAYDEANRLYTRTVPRSIGTSVTTTYGYSYDTGDLTSISYSDGTTPSVSFSYDRAGNRIGGTDAGGTYTQANTNGGQFLQRSYADGLLAGASVQRGYDSLGRRSTLQVGQNSHTLLAAGFNYDLSGRLDTVSEGTRSAVYGYGSNTDRISTIAMKSGTSTVLTQGRGYDTAGRLETISNSSSAPLSSHTYQYDVHNQRIHATLNDAAVWNYGYNTRGEVTGGTKTLAGGSALAGYQFGYSFDGIGNRLTADHGGDALGQNLIHEVYTPNDLNQYTGESVPGAAWIVGAATTTTTVSVNGTTASRQGTNYSQKITADNSAGPAKLPVTVHASGTSSITGQPLSLNQDGYMLLPPASRAFTYDFDGNLLSDGLWNYTWDGENRLAAVESDTRLPQAIRKRLEFAYDGESRRIGKKVYSWTGSQWQLTNTSTFLYDGWNLCAECYGTGAPIRTYLWGTDLSGTWDGAGGVGGLLCVNLATTHPSATSCFTEFDGNGNVVGLVRAADGFEVAKYEYGPFGEPLRTTGLGGLNPFQFSTKYADPETGLVYYGYRYYDPLTGRWPSRDLIGENGGVNLFGFTRNDGINKWDFVGNLPQAGYRPTEGENWLGRFALTWHAFVKFSDGTTNSNVGSEGTYTSLSTRYVSATRTKNKNKTLGSTGKLCKCVTDKEIEDNIKKYFRASHDASGFPFTNNCGSEVRDAFTSSCLEDPTPWWLYYPGGGN